MNRCTKARRIALRRRASRNLNRDDRTMTGRTTFTVLAIAQY
jgi:hypothetical protein